VIAIGVFGTTLGAAYQCILLSAVFGMSLLLLAVLETLRPCGCQHSGCTEPCLPDADCTRCLGFQSVGDGKL
jgi:hypothetical protein